MGYLYLEKLCAIYDQVCFESLGRGGEYCAGRIVKLREGFTVSCTGAQVVSMSGGLYGSVWVFKDIVASITFD